MGYRKHFLWTYLESLDTGIFFGEFLLILAYSGSKD